LEIVLFDNLPSTQTYLIEQVEKRNLNLPVAILALEQNRGVGSRNNEWQGGKGNFFVSIAIELNMLPDDLPVASASIYFSFIMKKVLKQYSENIWLKWPNDFYINSSKIGGTITKKINSVLICGIGINLKNSENGYRALQLAISPQDLLKKYLLELEKFPKWKQIFSEYEIEFELSRKFSVHINNNKESLTDACLSKDGSLLLGGKRVYSLR
jgi:BirA family biotin operon repressor/biotin-[acetyl-CoA-carboxylase] ligase